MEREANNKDAVYQPLDESTCIIPLSGSGSYYAVELGFGTGELWRFACRNNVWLVGGLTGPMSNLMTRSATAAFDEVVPRPKEQGDTQSLFEAHCT